MEVANFFSRSAARTAFLDLENDLRGDSLTEVVPSSGSLFNRGRTLFAIRLDKEWSLTDCTSFEVMTERAILAALTTDVQFVQAGFRALLLEDSK
jgi:predicted nucleic acid-binding protein